MVAFLWEIGDYQDVQRTYSKMVCLTEDGGGYISWLVGFCHSKSVQWD